jgi:hypothetical protein
MRRYLPDHSLCHSISGLHRRSEPISVAGALMVTCSSLGPGRMPWWRWHSRDSWDRRPAEQQIDRTQGTRLRTVIHSVCGGASTAPQSGDRDRYDEILAAGLAKVADSADAVVLAQASMARILDPGVSESCPSRSYGPGTCVNYQSVMRPKCGNGATFGRAVAVCLVFYILFMYRPVCCHIVDKGKWGRPRVDRERTRRNV